MSEKKVYTKATMLLLEDLEKAKTVENAGKVERIAALAKMEMYNDFKSPWATPQTFLHSHLQEAGLVELANNVTVGKYDD